MTCLPSLPKSLRDRAHFRFRGSGPRIAAKCSAGGQAFCLFPPQSEARYARPEARARARTVFGWRGKWNPDERPPNNAASAPNWMRDSAGSAFRQSRPRYATEARQRTPPMRRRPSPQPAGSKRPQHKRRRWPAYIRRRAFAFLHLLWTLTPPRARQRPPAPATARRC